ncbi:3-hydroxyacyl-CoA dehydrogenase/enoyl-CoA hydratase family protein [Conexibacter sp. CPCC 206217]|uniref:3-hydroxyacyl-CoA dehydrogenase/enoyl-CoA hydratase family protein n=1 Tax=Conexibacter sp. CPCC 206217 TaxID=3064574 RepID=UPI002726EDB9|nr:enoyl-CoA hydratase-related protein [Conexibacter sp. CPCC 206217]MDO8209371.1 enoyl-CoA hydratase-related protein [Conexibacter sp. CPCC 206217]
MFVFKAAVVGAGTMGGEIAYTIASADIPVVLKDVDQRFVDQGLAKARSIWQGQVDAGKLTPEGLEQKLALITGTTSYEEFGDVDFVIEAVPERMEIKQAVFAELDDVTPGHAILASNTSALSITEIAEATSRPDRVVGFHYFYPASMMRLIEVIEGLETSPETTQTASSFAQSIRKLPIRCDEAPGFVVNRILNSSFGEVFRFQEQSGAPIEAIDRAMTDARATPMGPFFLVDLLGLDTVGHVGRYLNESFGDRFPLHQGMLEHIERGELGAKTGQGFYSHGGGASAGGADAAAAEAPVAGIEQVVERFQLKALVEACLVLEEGIASTKDIDLGLMAGAGLIPPPFARADQEGLDTVLARLERAQEAWGEHFAPPAILRRLVAQGRLGAKSGQGFFAYPQPDAGWEEGPIKLQTRGATAIVWLDRPPANSLSPAVIAELARAWAQVDGDAAVRAVVFASANPALFCAGADVKAFTTMDEATGRALLDDAHKLFRSWEQSSTVTIAAVNALAFGGGCELAMATDVRIAAASASFGQPEVSLGIIPGFGGTQRLPRLVGEAKALELNLTGEPMSAEEAYEFGLVNRLVPDHELLDTALAWARKLAGQAPLAVQQIKQVSAVADLDEGIAEEKKGFALVFASEDAQEGIGAFLKKRTPRWQGK